MEQKFLLCVQLLWRTDEASKWPVFLHAVETYEEQFGKEVSYIVDMDVTVPLKTAADIDGAIKMAL